MRLFNHLRQSTQIGQSDWPSQGSLAPHSDETNLLILKTLTSTVTPTFLRQIVRLRFHCHLPLKSLSLSISLQERYWKNLLEGIQFYGIFGNDFLCCPIGLNCLKWNFSSRRFRISGADFWRKSYESEQISATCSKPAVFTKLLSRRLKVLSCVSSRTWCHLLILSSFIGMNNFGFKLCGNRRLPWVLYPFGAGGWMHSPSSYYLCTASLRESRLLNRKLKRLDSLIWWSEVDRAVQLADMHPAERAIK